MTRRALTRGAAWAIPAVIVAAQAPALAASPACPGWLRDGENSNVGNVYPDNAETPTAILQINPQYICEEVCVGLPASGEVQLGFRIPTSTYSVDPSTWTVPAPYTFTVTETASLVTVVLTHPSIGPYGQMPNVRIPLTIKEPAAPAKIQSATLRGCFNNVNIWYDVPGS